MTVPPANETRELLSPFERIIAIGYYDGPTAGFAIDKENILYYFHLLDWDDWQDLRVFEIDRIFKFGFDDLMTNFDENNFSPSWPVSVLMGEHANLLSKFTEDCQKSTTPIAIVVTENLIETIKLWKPINDKIKLPEPYNAPPYHGGFNGTLLESLGFSKKGRTD